MKRVLTVCSSREHARPNETVPYEEALRAVGVEPVIASPENFTSLEDVSGLMLIGGTDVNPSRYGEERAPGTDEPDDLRDQLEWTLIDEALRRDLPVLAICRGLQILNVQHGGSLVQHIEGHRVRTPEDPGKPAHSVEIEPGTMLARIAAHATHWDVNSRHHQAIAKPGKDLRISARAQDGVIEAVERPDKRFVVAVQWHPENQFAAKEEQARLFEAFATAL